MPIPNRRWTHPQAVPRGFLRLYMLTLLNRGPQSGYSIMQAIEERTEGAWHPGPGTVYPLLKSLASEGLVKPSPGRGSLGTKEYLLTRKGAGELERIRRSLPGTGRGQPAMGRLYAEVLPARAVVQVMLRLAREGLSEFGARAAQLPPAERDSALAEMKVLLQRQVQSLERLEGEAANRRSRKGAEV